LKNTLNIWKAEKSKEAKMTEDKKDDLPSKEEIKQKAGLFWRISKGFFKYTFKLLWKIIIPRKWDKPHIAMSLIAIAVIILFFFFFVKPIINFISAVVIIAAIIAIFAGIYMVISGKPPISKDKKP